MPSRNKQSTLPVECQPSGALTRDIPAVDPCPQYDRPCLVCGVERCTLITHRFLAVQLSRRASDGTTKKIPEDAREQDNTNATVLQQKPGRPKPIPRVPRLQTKRRFTPGKKTCLVCSSSACRLMTHQRYAADSLSSKSRVAPSVFSDTYGSVDESTVSTSDTVPTVVAGTFPRSITGSVKPGLADPHLKLPSFFNDIIFKQAFYDFFTVKSKRIADSQRVGQSFAKDFNESFLARALVDETLCVSVMSLSMAHAADRRLLAGIESNPGYARILNQAFQLVSRDLRIGPSESTLVATLALAVAQGIFVGSQTASQVHLEGAHAIISSLGGVTRICGRFLNLLQDIAWNATLLDAATVDFLQVDIAPVMLTNPPHRLYGWKLQHLTDILDPEVHRTCEDSCRLTELLEHEATILATPIMGNMSKWTYFEYLRDIQYGRLARLHIKYRGTNTIEECIVTALNLYTLLVSHASPCRAPQVRLCTRIRTMLVGLDHHPRWACESTAHEVNNSTDSPAFGIDQDIILWTLFVTFAAMQQIEYTPHEWVLDLILDELSRETQLPLQDWSEEWHQRQLSRLKGFCWSETFLTKHYFGPTCDMLIVRASVRQSLEFSVE